MKKLITAMLALAAIAPLSAQQLPNNGFEEDWVAFTPYSTGTVKAIGTAPSPWKVSNTYGLNGTGKKETSKEIAGHDSASAIEVFNAETGMKFGIINLTRVVPGYVTLGTPWSTSQGTGKNTDGGTFGGIEFTYQPDALECHYKATGSDASVVVYAWKGSYFQKGVPAEISTSTPKTTDMTDRERCILGKETSQGGEKSQSEDAALLYSAIYSAKTAADWTRCEVPFKYENNTAKPEKFNVIFCAGDYFDANPVLDRTMSVDDVKLLYYSRLKTLTVNGVEANLEDAVFDKDGHCTYDLSESINMPRSVKAIKWECLGESPAKKVDIIALDAENNTATITVKNTNEGATDVDGKAEHVYTIKFKAPRVVEGGIEYPGHITTLTMDGGSLIGDDEEKILVEASIWMTRKGSKRIVDVLLPDLALPGMGTIGDILVENVTRTYNNNNGSPIYDYTGHVDDLSLLEGFIHAVVDLEGTSDVDGNVNFKIHVNWISNYEDLHPQAIVAREAVEPEYTPIEVEFNGRTATPEVPTGINDVTVDGSDAPVEYFDLQGIRVSNPQAGRMVIRRQGTNVEKILVK